MKKRGRVCKLHTRHQNHRLENLLTLARIENRDIGTQENHQVKKDKNNRRSIFSHPPVCNCWGKALQIGLCIPSLKHELFDHNFHTKGPGNHDEKCNKSTCCRPFEKIVIQNCLQKRNHLFPDNPQKGPKRHHYVRHTILLQ